MRLSQYTKISAPIGTKLPSSPVSGVKSLTKSKINVSKPSLPKMPKKPDSGSRMKIAKEIGGKMAKKKKHCRTNFIEKNIYPMQKEPSSNIDNKNESRSYGQGSSPLSTSRASGLTDDDTAK